jgi:hypothetical protein
MANALAISGINVSARSVVAADTTSRPAIAHCHGSNAPAGLARISRHRQSGGLPTSAARREREEE